MYCCVNNKEPIFFSKYFTRTTQVSSRHTRQSLNNYKLYIPCYRFNKLQRCIKSQGVQIWEQIPNELKTSHIIAFKADTKSFYYPLMSIQNNCARFRFVLWFITRKCLKHSIVLLFSMPVYAMFVKNSEKYVVHHTTTRFFVDWLVAYLLDILRLPLLLYPYWTLLNLWHLVVAWLDDRMVLRNLPVVLIS